MPIKKIDNSSPIFLCGVQTGYQLHCSKAQSAKQVSITVLETSMS